MKKFFIPNYIELKKDSSKLNYKNLDIYVKEIIREIIRSKRKILYFQTKIFLIFLILMQIITLSL